MKKCRGIILKNGKKKILREIVGSVDVCSGISVASKEKKTTQMLSIWKVLSKLIWCPSKSL